jgi:hypothetical protein
LRAVGEGIVCHSTGPDNARPPWARGHCPGGIVLHTSRNCPRDFLAAAPGFGRSPHAMHSIHPVPGDQLDADDFTMTSDTFRPDVQPFLGYVPLPDGELNFLQAGGGESANTWAKTEDCR